MKAAMTAVSLAFVLAIAAAGAPHVPDLGGKFEIPTATQGEKYGLECNMMVESQPYPSHKQGLCAVYDKHGFWLGVNGTRYLFAPWFVIDQASKAIRGK